MGFEATTGNMPDGWQIRAATIDTAVRSEGNASLRLASTASQGPPGSVTAIASQTVSAGVFDGDRLRLAGDIKTERVGPGYAGIWLRIEGPQGFQYIDDMRDIPLSGTQEWSRYEIEVAVPPETTLVMYGVHLSGTGTAWFDDLALTAYASSSLPPPSEAVATYMNSVLDIMQTNSIVRESVSWDRFRQSAYVANAGWSRPSR